MRIDGYGNSYYTHQAQSFAVPDAKEKVETEITETTQDKRNVQEVLPKETGEQIPLWKRMESQVKKDWEQLQVWTKKALVKTKELLIRLAQFLKKVYKEIEDSINKVGNPAAMEEKKVESGVTPLTWQETFKLRVRVVFEAVTGFLAKHLPMNQGGSSGTKEEKRKDEVPNKEKKQASGDEKNYSGSTFDQRG